MTSGVRANGKRNNIASQEMITSDNLYLSSGNCVAHSLSGPKPFVDLRDNEGRNAGIRTAGLQDTQDLVTYWKHN